MDAARFFEKALPQLIADNLEGFAALDGVVTFDVAGAGAWTLHLGRVEGPVEGGANEAADLTLSFDPAAFAAFIDGTLDVVRALDSGAITFRGEPELLARLGFLMRPKTNLLGVRSASF